MTDVRGQLALLLAVGTTGLLVAGPAGAATVIGQAPPTAGMVGNCAADVKNSSMVQTSSVGNGYTVPAGGGVITEWRHQANGIADQILKLRVFTGVGAQITAVAESEFRTLTPSSLNSFPTRIPVAGGELIGSNSGPDPQSQSACLYLMTGNGLDVVYYSGNNNSPPVGTPATYTALSQYRVNIAAVLEPDADRDGFGDESQDGCPTDPSKQAECVAPDTTITKGPRDRTTKRSARFEFAGVDAGAIAGFECALDGSAFAPCAAPYEIKVGKGTHVLSVRAIDQAGNVDATPATARWKVKKKQKKK